MSTAEPATRSQSSLPSEGEKKLLYTVLAFCHPPVLYALYVFEINGGEDPKTQDREIPAPVLKLDYSKYPFGMQFFSAGPKIYMVGGSYCDQIKVNGRITIDGGCTGMHIYDTQTGLLRTGPPMRTGKGDGTRVVSPPVAGKYYVVGFDKFVGLSMEAFCADSESWSVVSPCPFFSTELLQAYPRDFRIDAYSVVNTTIVLSVLRWYSYTDRTSRGIVMYNIDEDVWEILVDQSVELPFFGPAFYAENGWFGLSYGKTRGTTDLCGFKVTDCFRFSHKRRVLNFVDPKEFSHSTDDHLVYMGDKKLCVVRTGNIAGFMGDLRPEPLVFWTSIVVLEISTQPSSSSSSSGWKWNATKQLSSNYWMYGAYENFGRVIAALVV